MSTVEGHLARSEPAAGAPLHEFERLTLRNYPLLTAVVLMLMVACDPDRFRAAPAQWDWLWLSGVALLLVTYPLSLRVPHRVAPVAQRLADAGVLVPADRVPEFVAEMNRTASRYARSAGRLSLLVTGLAWLAVLGTWIVDGYPLGPAHLGTMLLETLLGVPVGRFLGRAVCYGGFAGTLRRSGLRLEPIAGHPDNLGGLGSLIGLLTGCFGLLLLILGYLEIWLLLIGLLPMFGGYAYWRVPYQALMILVTVVGLALVLRAFTTIRAGIGRPATGAGSVLPVGVVAVCVVATGLLVVPAALLLFLL